MQNITLTLKPYHLAQLREAVRAHIHTVETDPASTVADRAVCADLEARVNLLANAIAIEFAAKEARRKYNATIRMKPQLSGHRKRKQTEKLTEAQRQEPPQLTR